MKSVITIIVLALVAWGAYTLLGNREVSENTQPVTQEQNTQTSTTTTSNTATSTIKEFTVVGRNFAFSPSTIQVNKGDRVRIVFQSQGTHDWVVDEFDARTRVLSNGQSETIEFVADESGTFEYYCSVGTHREMGMVGTLVVQ